MIKKLLIGLLVILVISQFIRPSLNKGQAHGPDNITSVVKVPDSIHSILQTACYDCHSNNTSYPWYSRVTPVNWWLNNHIDEGKKHLNFSIYAKYNFKQKEHKLEEIGETVAHHEMPIESYLLIHHEARLTREQRRAIIDWAQLARQEVMTDSLKARLKQ